MEKAILDVQDISELIGKSPKAIRIAMSRGQEGITVPPSTKIGGRRVWVREVVDQWLKDIATQAMEEYEEKKRAAHDLYHETIKPFNNKPLEIIRGVLETP